MREARNRRAPENVLAALRDSSDRGAACPSATARRFGAAKRRPRACRCCGARQRTRRGTGLARRCCARRPDRPCLSAASGCDRGSSVAPGSCRSPRRSSRARRRSRTCSGRDRCSPAAPIEAAASRLRRRRSTCRSSPASPAFERERAGRIEAKPEVAHRERATRQRRLRERRFSHANDAREQGRGNAPLVGSKVQCIINCACLSAESASVSAVCAVDWICPCGRNSFGDLDRPIEAVRLDHQKEGSRIFGHVGHVFTRPAAIDGHQQRAAAHVAVQDDAEARRVRLLGRSTVRASHVIRRTGRWC